MEETQNEIAVSEVSQTQRIIHNLKNQIYKFNEINKVEKDKSKLEEEINILINGLLAEELSTDKLGGLIALRGFIYQYYVAIYNMLEMLYNNKWEYLAYEYIDDIALLGIDKIRFIQVKTEREDGQAHSLSPNLITKREKKLDSWLDKLFLNKYEIETKKTFQSVPNIQNKEFSYEFELATNMTYDSKGILSYYSDSEKTKHKDDKLAEFIDKPFIKDGEVHKFTDYIPEGAEWCLNRLTIKYYGRTEKLWIDIIHKIIGLINDKDYEIANRIFEKILINLLERTHNDNLKEKDNRKILFFSSSEIRLWIEEFEKDARNAVDAKRQSKLLATAFNDCFNELHIEIERNWSNPWKQRLIETLLWLKDSLDKQKDKNPFILEIFINRLFFLANNRTVSIKIDASPNWSYLLNSLRSIIYYMTFYQEKAFIFDTDTNFILKQGQNDNSLKQLFAIFNARKKETIIVCRELIEEKLEQCSLLSKINEDIYFFVIDSEKEVKTNRFIKNKITTSSEYPKITSSYSNIKILDGKFIEDFLNELRDALKETNVEYDEALKSWILELNEKVKKG
ncbi:dsDNA nuclease domain-containing protein [Saccharococcus caldoxylosilyticus]|uniref:dsDNA nuclease domain-containing protein n=1 Tax=Saccharococcus caldoxylosilyticus TaxID=81408 RepID=UPI0002E237DB|nr:dsDNA nuclease domain-containing protein [Parageobacillus caldoxylosilyticus]